jgi:hypothetical protein
VYRRWIDRLDSLLGSEHPSVIRIPVDTLPESAELGETVWVS